jgi:acetyl-CoA carboxylase beta subunit
MVKQELIEKGCWACGWRGTEEEIELAKVKRESGAIGQEGKAVGESYKTRCPNCGKLVITKELKEKGCYICGWKLSSPLKGEE